jgi:SPP1 gp7 family putative phage head morphogenesis protein
VSFVSNAAGFLGQQLAKFSGTEAVGRALFPSWQTGPRLGADGVLSAYTTMPWLRAFTQKISHDTATLTWQVFVPTRKENGKVRAFRDLRLQRSHNYRDRVALLRQYAKNGDLREIPNHPALDLLTQGNEWFSGLVSLQLSQQYVDLIGELAWILDVNKFGMPTKYVPIPPTWVTELPASNRTSTSAGFYRVVGPGATYEVPAERMFWAYHPNPSNPFSRGNGLAQVLGDELETDEFAAKHTKDWFRNRAIPPVLISGIGMGIAELQRLEQKWLGKFLKVGAGWLPHFMNADVKVHQLSQSFQQQELGALRKNERDTIRMVYGIPPEIIGDVSASNRSTIDASDFIYQSRVIVPRAEFLRAALQERLMPLYDDRLIVDYISPVQEDRAFMLEVRKAAPWAWELDEWRELGLSEPLANGRGNVHMMPFNTVPVRLSAGEMPQPPSPPVPEIPEDTDAIDAEDVTLVEDSARPSRRLASASVERALSASDLKKIANASDVAVLTARGQRTMESIVQEFGSQAIIDAGLAISFDLQDPKVQDHIRRWGAERMTLVNDTTKEAIRTALADGIKEGESSSKLRQRIMDVFEECSESRAAMIARTEITRSSNFGAFEGLRQAGVEDKEWLSTQDGEVRDTHIELDGQRVTLEEEFEIPSTKAKAMYPGDFGDPGEDCNCRCGVITALAVRSGARMARWKTMEADRAPFLRKLRNDFRSAFKVQEKAVLAALSAATRSGEEACRRTA